MRCKGESVSVSTIWKKLNAAVAKAVGQLFLWLKHKSTLPLLVTQTVKRSLCDVPMEQGGAEGLSRRQFPAMHCSRMIADPGVDVGGGPGPAIKEKKKRKKKGFPLSKRAKKVQRTS